MPDFVSNEEIVLAARKNLIQGTWDYLVGGSESETTLRRNRQAFDKVAFRPRILVDVSKIDTSTTFLGQPMRIQGLPPHPARRLVLVELPHPPRHGGSGRLRQRVRRLEPPGSRSSEQ